MGAVLVLKQVCPISELNSELAVLLPLEHSGAMLNANIPLVSGFGFQSSTAAILPKHHAKQHPQTLPA